MTKLLKRRHICDLGVNREIRDVHSDPEQRTSDDVQNTHSASDDNVIYIIYMDTACLYTVQFELKTALSAKQIELQTYNSCLTDLV